MHAPAPVIGSTKHVRARACRSTHLHVCGPAVGLKVLLPGIQVHPPLTQQHLCAGRDAQHTQVDGKVLAERLHLRAHAAPIEQRDLPVLCTRAGLARTGTAWTVRMPGGLQGRQDPVRSLVGICTKQSEVYVRSLVRVSDHGWFWTAATLLCPDRPHARGGMAAWPPPPPAGPRHTAPPSLPLLPLLPQRTPSTAASLCA